MTQRTKAMERAAGSPGRLSALGAAVRERRRALGLRQAELADLAGCSERFIHTVEHGKESLRLGKVLDVLEVLGLGLSVGPGRGDVSGLEKGARDRAGKG